LPRLFVSMIVCLFGENTCTQGVEWGWGQVGDLKVRKFLEGLGI